METGRFYFVSDSFYERFKECGLVDNKAERNGEEHNRPCCYLFKYWSVVAPREKETDVFTRTLQNIDFEFYIALLFCFCNQTK